MRTLPFLSLISALVLSSSLHASPRIADTEDDFDRFLVELGTPSQLDQVQQTLRSKTSELVVTAMGFLGVPYKAGGTNVENGGFDCSGFVRSMYEQAMGLALPRSAEQQASATQLIDKTELIPGDLVFFNTMRRAFSHVGIYVGDNKFIHSPKPGHQVRLESMDLAYWAKRFDGARRVLPVDTDSGAATPR